MDVLICLACTTIEKQQRTVYNDKIEADKTINIRQDHPNPVLRVATLNIAHGRKDSMNQLLVWGDTFKENLDDIAKVLNQHKPQLVALQDADAESRWSGSFDHVAYIALNSEYPWRTHVSNAESWSYSYGTALLSELPLVKTIQHTFQPSPPTLDKGFVLAQIEWTTGGGSDFRKVDIISVHLDFSRQAVREKQIAEMREILSARMNSTIIMGDFNSEWLSDASVVKELATNSRFLTYKPEDKNYNTYKVKRLDWILISKDLEFVNYRVLPETLSDHAMVLSEIRFKTSADEVKKIPVSTINNFD